MTPLVLIAAMGRNRAIGRDNRLPWRLAGDMTHFRDLTMWRPLIVGRRTWQSIGRPLPGRRMIVVSSDPGLVVPPEVMLCRDPASAADRGRGIAAATGADAVMVAGGATIYAALMDQAARIEITEIELDPEADAFFPVIDPASWREISRRPQAPGPSDDVAYEFVAYERH